MASNKKHWFFAYATYVNLADDSLNQSKGEFSLESKNITRAIFKGIESDLIEVTKSKNPTAIIDNFQLISLSYLGEMTDEDFNS